MKSETKIAARVLLIQAINELIAPPEKTKAEKAIAAELRRMRRRFEKDIKSLEGNK